MVGHARTALLLTIGCLPLVRSWMPAPNSQSLNVGDLDGPRSDLVRKVWAHLFFTFPGTEKNVLLQAAKSSTSKVSVDARNITEVLQASVEEGKMPVHSIPVDQVPQDDLLWNVYNKEVERYKEVDNGLARGGRYPRVNSQHLELMLENVFQNVRSDETDTALKSSVRMYITRKFFSYNLLSLNHVFQFKPTDLRALELALTGDQPQQKQLDLMVKVEQEEPMGVNVVGVLPGRRWGTAGDRMLIVGAHYDTVPHSPGFDDNGSGVAAMLEAARALSENGCRPEFSLLFVAFDLEEVGGAGSMAFIHQFLNAKILEPAGWPDAQGAFILDTIMNYNATRGVQTVPAPWVTQMLDTIQRLDENDARGDFLAAIYRRHVDKHLADAYIYHYQRLGQLDRFRVERFDVDLPAERPSDDVLFNHMDVMRSDHSRFWYVSRGTNQTAAPSTIPAVLLTDTGPFRGVMARCYHAECDSARVMHHANADNLPFLTHSTQALVNTLVDLGGARCSGRPLVAPPPPLPSVSARRS